MSFPKTSLDNVVICASAGSGKTYQLAQRYIRLLREGVSPDRICALTFTRKAAGEMFDKIVNELLETLEKAEAESKARRELTGILRRLLQEMPRLQISTLDSFASGMAGAFAFELGLPAVITLMDSESPEGRAERRRLLNRMTDTRLLDATSRHDLLEVFQLASHGLATKRNLTEQMEEFIRLYGRALREMHLHWGDLSRVFPKGIPFHALSEAECVAIFESLEKSLREEIPALAENVLPVLHACAFFTATSPLPDFSGTLSKQLLKFLDKKTTALVYRNIPHPLRESTRENICRILQHVAAVDLKRLEKRTQGVYRALDKYLDLETEHIVRTGRMTFDDLTRLLTAADASFTSTAQTADFMEKRIYIDFRMDCRLDHYMLDEFQDTSDRQWKMLQPLISEVVTPPPGEKRSFFYVGDVKQSIYGWRGGNYHLFGKVRQQFEDFLREERLNASWRSSPAVIETVNRVFSLKHQQKESVEAIPKAAIGFWAKQWDDHTIAGCKKEKPGIAELIQYLDEEGVDKTEAAALVISDVIRRLEGEGKRNLTTAVLVRSNDQGTRMADVLKKQGITVAVEGKQGILDTPLTHLAISLVQIMTHPGDTVAWGHLQMSPLGVVYAATCGTPDAESGRELRGAFALKCLQCMQEKGFEGLFKEELLPFLCKETFTPHDARRWQDLMRVARQFDATQSTDGDEFIREIEGYTARDTPSAGVVRIMTIHQSKGLGFDVVFVPFNNSGNKNTLSSPAAEAFITGKDWALLRPASPTFDMLPLFAETEEQPKADKAYESLAVLYVALTRAANALYMIIPPPPKKDSPTVRDSTLLREALQKSDKSIETYSSGGSVLYRTGDPFWFRKMPLFSAQEETPAFSADNLRLPKGEPPLKRFEPSAAEKRTLTVSQLLDPEYLAIRDFGIAIHRLFSKISWLSETDIESEIVHWRETAPEDPLIITDAEKQFRTVIARPSFAEILTRPEAPHILWLEMPFSVRLSRKEYIGGQFDRVVIFNDADGKPIRAVIYDYKSSMVNTRAQAIKAAENYFQQMTYYRRCLAKLLALPLATITAELLFTRTGDRIPVAFHN